MRTLKQVSEFTVFSIFTLLFLTGWAASPAFADAPLLPVGTAPAAATGAAGALAQGAAPGFGSMLAPMAAMFAVVYFLMIRPQQKKQKEQQSMLSQLKHGDEVVTSAGILGTIAGITEKVVTVEVDKDVRIKILKSQVSQVVKGQIKDLAV